MYNNYDLFIVQGRLQEDKKMFSFSFDIKKACDAVWRDGLWYRMWEMTR